MGRYRNKKSSKGLETSEWDSFLPVGKEVKMQTPGTVAAPYRHPSPPRGPVRMQRLRTNAPAQATAGNTSPRPRDRTRPEPKRAPCPFTPRKRRGRNVYQWLSHAMGWGQRAEPRPGSPCLEGIFESRTGAFTRDPDASFSPGPDPRPSSPSWGQECA